MDTILDTIKTGVHKVLVVLKRLETIIICLVILGLFGMALLEINDAIDPTPSPQQQADMLLKQSTEQVRYNKKAIEKVNDLINVESTVKPSKQRHSDNPFEF